MMHEIDIATYNTADRIRGQIRIDVADPQTAEEIAALYRKADAAVYTLLTGEVWAPVPIPQ